MNEVWHEFEMTDQYPGTAVSGFLLLLAAHSRRGFLVRRRHYFDQSLNDIIRRYSLGIGIERRHEPMP